MPVRGKQGSQVGSQGLQTGSHGEQDTGSHGSQYGEEPPVQYTVCGDCTEVAAGKNEPVRQKLDKLPLAQPRLTEDKRATAQSNANFFMIWSPQ